MVTHDKQYLELTKKAWCNFEESHHRSDNKKEEGVRQNDELILRHLELDQACIRYLITKFARPLHPTSSCHAFPRKLTLHFSKIQKTVLLSNDMTSLLHPIEAVKAHGILGSYGFSDGTIIGSLLCALLEKAATSSCREIDIGFADLRVGEIDEGASTEVRQSFQNNFYLKQVLRKLPRLTTFELFACKLDQASVTEMAKGLEGHPTLQKLTLNFCVMNQGLCHELLSTSLTKTPCSCLQELSLPRNAIDISCLPTLTKVLKTQTSLRRLDISDNHTLFNASSPVMTESHIKPFLDSICHHGSLEQLRIRNVQLNNQSAQHLMLGLASGSPTLAFPNLFNQPFEPRLQKLYMDKNPLSDGSWLDALAHVTCLTHLAVEPRGSISKERLQETLGQNKSLIWLHWGGCSLGTAEWVTQRNRYLGSNPCRTTWPNALSRLCQQDLVLHRDMLFEFVQRQIVEECGRGEINVCS